MTRPVRRTAGAADRQARHAPDDLVFADVPVPRESLAGHGLPSVFSPDDLSRLQHLMDGRDVVALRLPEPSTTGPYPLVRFVVAEVITINGQHQGPVWVVGGPREVTYVALDDLAHLDCAACGAVVPPSARGRQSWLARLIDRTRTRASLTDQRRADPSAGGWR